MTVIIANEHSAPRETVHPGMLFSQITPPALGCSARGGRNQLDTGKIGDRASHHSIQQREQTGLRVSQRR
jgi:hypothetical protein